MRLKVGAYCRVSTDSKDQANSFDSQKKYFYEHIKSNDKWELVEIYADEGFSGTQTQNRPEFNRMIQDAKDKRIDLILTKEISRFARNTQDSIQYTRLLKSFGVGVKFINDNINTLDGDGELRLTIMAGIAQDESRRTSERVKWGQQRRMEQGIVFGRELLGYNLKNGVLSINTEESYIVEIIFRKYLEGKGTHIIARELYEANIVPKRSKTRWSNTMILKVLRNEKYVGDLAQKKTFTPDFLDHKKKYTKDTNQLVYLKNHHEAIIDREMWEAVQLELSKRTTSEEQKIRYSNRYWCSGKIICGNCGSKYISKIKKLKNGQIYKAWRCFQTAKYGTQKLDHSGTKVGCNSASVNNLVLSYTINYLLTMINSNKDEIIEELIQEIKILKKVLKIKNTNSLENKIDKLNIKKQEIIDNMLEGIISKKDLVLMNKKYDEEIDKISSEIKAIEDVNFLNSKKGDNLQIYIDRINEIVNFDNDNIEEIYKKVVDKIIVYNENVIDVYLNCIKDPVKLTYFTNGRNNTFSITVAISQS